MAFALAPRHVESHSANPPKLLDRVRQAIRVRHYSRRTEDVYVTWIRRFIVFCVFRPS